MHPRNRPYLAPNHRWDGLTVGLYGGSFNPAHGGHLHVSLRAMRRLRLHALWWLVSPLNPLKDAGDVADLEKRLEVAYAVADHPRIHVTALEEDLDTRYSLDTLRFLMRRHVRTRFIWIMGADNLATFHFWEGWQQIFHMLPIAVFDRPGYSLEALNSPAARKFRAARLKERESFELAAVQAPAWVFIPGPLHPASATALRAQMPDWLKGNDMEQALNWANKRRFKRFQSHWVDG